MAAPVLRATDEYNVVTSNTGTVNLPTGTVDGDLIFFISQHRAVYSNSSPSGLTYLGQLSGGSNLGQFELWYRVANSEPSSYTWGFASAERVRILAISYVGGFFDTTTPFDVLSATAYNTTDTIARAASMTVTNQYAHLFYFGCAFRTSAVTFSTPTVPTAFAENYDNGSVNPDMWNAVSCAQWSGSGATGTMDVTISQSIPSKAAFAVAINPSSGSIPTFTGSAAILMQMV